MFQKDTKDAYIRRLYEIVKIQFLENMMTVKSKIHYDSFIPKSARHA